MCMGRVVTDDAAPVTLKHVVTKVHGDASDAGLVMRSRAPCVRRPQMQREGDVL